jgi:hypothetical protein
MEIAVPLVALSSLYLISNQNSAGGGGGAAAAGGVRPAPAAPRMEGFQTYTAGDSRTLPNTNIPDKNYPDSTAQNLALDQTAELSVINRYRAGVTPTDKYFTPGASGGQVSVASTQPRTFQSLTGEDIHVQSFTHNNMTPFFGGKIRGATADANTHEGILDAYSGAGSQIITKTEQSPLFRPDENTQFAYGAPSATDFIQKRMTNVASQSMNGVRPFAQQQVGPGLGLGADEIAAGGFNSGVQARDQWRDRTVDELRVASNPKASEYGLLGYEGAPIHYNPTNASAQDIGAFEKNRPDRHFEMSSARYFRTTGMAQSAPIGDQLAVAAEIVEKHVTRPETTTNYAGIAAAQTEATYVPGTYMEPRGIQLGAPDFTPAARAGAADPRRGDYSVDSNRAYTNNRTANATGGDYFSPVGGAITAIIAPLLDVLRPNRREDTQNNLRSYENPRGPVANPYIYNPADQPAPTIRQTTGSARNLNLVNRNQEGGAYMVTEHQAVDTHRLNSVSYSGTAGAVNTHAQRNYTAEYAQRNNDVKSSTLASYTPGGKMELLNADMNMTILRNDGANRNMREYAPTAGPIMPVGSSQYGALSGTGERYSSNIELQRNTGDVMGNVLRQNPYTTSYMGVA